MNICVDDQPDQLLIIEGVEEDRPHLAALSAVRGIGPSTQKHILLHLKKNRIKWKEFWELNQVNLGKIRLTEKQINSINNFKRANSIYSYYQRLQFREIRAITYADNEYPPLLTELDRAPLVLYARGPVIDWVGKQSVAVVGARGMTEYGGRATQQLVMELVEQGMTIISGFMYGVDTCAHLTALKYGGQTVGVLGYGFGQVYPNSHRTVFNDCIKKGMTFYSPFPLDLAAKPGNFPARNQVVAGMSQGVLVTEAAAKSGSLITAGVAADLGREVFAVPAPFDSDYVDGTIQLINQGATMVRSGYELVEYLQWPSTPQQRYNLFKQSSEKLKAKYDLQSNPDRFSQISRQDLGKFSPLTFQVLATLSRGKQTYDSICEELECNYLELADILSQLELIGLAKSQGISWQLNR